MEKTINMLTVALTAVGTFLATAFGGVDQWLFALLGLMALDYITGVVKGIYNKQLSSQIGFKGICKKMMILICVAVCVILQKITNIPVREVVICFYIANEGISLIENMAEIIPIPQKVKDILLQLRDKSVKKEKEIAKHE